MPIRLTDKQRGPLGARLFHARRRAGLEQTDLAREIGITTAAYARWETGRTPQPDIAHLSKAADVLGVTVGYLVAGERSINADSLSQLRAEIRELSQRVQELGEKTP